MAPKVSIIMATYNRANLIGESLRAIQNQTYRDWECIIIDDGGKDGTARVIKKFLKDSRFQFFKRKPKYVKGLPGCRNYGLDLAKGNYLVFFDDDDIPHPQLLELAIEELNKSVNDFCRYNRSTFSGHFKDEFDFIQDSTVRPITIRDIEPIVKNELPFNSCQVLWKRSSIGQMRFVESLMYAEEWEFYSRLLCMGLKGITINHVLYFGRKHPNSNTGEFQRKAPIRLNSQINAAMMVIENLSSSNLFNEKLKVFFVRMGFELNALEIIKKSLDAAGKNNFEKLKYQIAYKFYPILKPIFYLKGKILKA